MACNCNSRLDCGVLQDKNIRHGFFFFSSYYAITERGQFFWFFFSMKIESIIKLGNNEPAINDRQSEKEPELNWT